MFKSKPSWAFPSNNYGQIIGIADSGVETFKGTPIKSLAREICQNSLDAAQNNDSPARIEFRAFEISWSDIPDNKNLEDALKRSREFWNLQKSTKAKAFFKKALQTAQQKHLMCLRISDFNTRGLEGAHETYNSPWCNLTKSSGASDKSGDRGGSFGIGKFAPFACSDVRTVFYSTCDIQGQCASQGIARLTSFKNKKGEITQGIGFYGNDKNSPMYTQYSLDKKFARNEDQPGTDIFIVGFNGEKDWQHQLTGSILDGFLYAVFNGSLIVSVDNILISKETLPELMASHKSYFKEHADEYYQTLTDEKKARTFCEEITGDPETEGRLKLRLMIMPGFSRRVAMIRQTGMKIQDKGNISGLIPFAGTLFIEGDMINAFLRGLENPQHLDWEVDRAENKSKATRLLRRLRSFIKDSLNEMKSDVNEDALDPTVGAYLAEFDDTVSKEDELESITDVIKDIKIQVTEILPAPSGLHSKNESDSQAEGIEFGGVLEGELPNSEHSSSAEADEHPEDKNKSRDGESEETNEKHRISRVAAISVRNIVRNKDRGEYSLVFTPDKSAENGSIEVFMSAESQNYQASVLSAATEDGCSLKCRGNSITNIRFVEKQPVKLNIQLDYHDYCSLEVKAYGD